MPISDFSGKTYVAFSDLNGFKEMMRNHRNAAKALDKLYSTVYELKTKSEYSGIQTLAISDCAISFVSNSNSNNTADLPLILKFIKDLHTKMLNADYLITSSIACGQFDYHERIELPGLEKNMLYGNAYLNAYLNNEKCPAGSIAIICEGSEKDNILQSSGEHKEFLRDIRRNVKGLQFYWAVPSGDSIDKFKTAYQDTYNLKYKGMISVYKDYLRRT
ncbi:MAG TPA: hypothetical protein ACFYD6_13780 [Candidatus Brocadiia bacterium]|nr:hypothetical protein [Candidatus Brocadiales bacterium]